MLPCSEAQTELLKAVAETGSLDKIDWSDLQLALKDRLKSVLDYYIEKNKDGREEEFQETYNEKFNFEASRDEIIDLINSFNDAPFTIQRICELLYSPFNHYDKLNTFLRGLEKNLRVTSFNSNWPNERRSRRLSNCSETRKNDCNNCEDEQPSTQKATEEAINELTTRPQPPELQPPPIEPQPFEATVSEAPQALEQEELVLDHELQPKEQVADEQLNREQLDEQLFPVDDKKDDISSPISEEMSESTINEAPILGNECQQNKD